MAKHPRSPVMLWICALVSMPFSASAINNCSTTNFYMFPAGQTIYQCCSGAPEFPTQFSPFSAADQEAPKESARSKVTINEKSSYTVRKSLQARCVNLAELTPHEKFLRNVMSLSCIEIGVIEHIACSCEIDCLDRRMSDCPGVPSSECPTIPSHQDSLRSQPEFLGATYSPCNLKSHCGG
jgi:hypothetical protein